jgi:hypothetical protein
MSDHFMNDMQGAFRRAAAETWKLPWFCIQFDGKVLEAESS